jgi:hypothetical protein
MKRIALLLLILITGCQSDLPPKKWGDYTIDKVYDTDYYFPYKVYPCSMYPGSLENIPVLNISPDFHFPLLFSMVCANEECAYRDRNNHYLYLSKNDSETRYLIEISKNQKILLFRPDKLIRIRVGDKQDSPFLIGQVKQP